MTSCATCQEYLRANKITNGDLLTHLEKLRISEIVNNRSTIDLVTNSHEPGCTFGLLKNIEEFVKKVEDYYNTFSGHDIKCSVCKSAVRDIFNHLVTVSENIELSDDDRARVAIGCADDVRLIKQESATEFARSKIHTTKYFTNIKISRPDNHDRVCGCSPYKLLIDTIQGCKSNEENEGVRIKILDILTFKGDQTKNNYKWARDAYDSIFIKNEIIPNEIFKKKGKAPRLFLIELSKYLNKISIDKTDQKYLNEFKTQMVAMARMNQTDVCSKCDYYTAHIIALYFFYQVSGEILANDYMMGRYIVSTIKLDEQATHATIDLLDMPDSQKWIEEDEEYKTHRENWIGPDKNLNAPSGIFFNRKGHSVNLTCKFDRQLLNKFSSPDKKGLFKKIKKLPKRSKSHSPVRSSSPSNLGTPTRPIFSPNQFDRVKNSSPVDDESTKSLKFSLDDDQSFTEDESDLSRSSTPNDNGRPDDQSFNEDESDLSRDPTPSPNDDRRPVFFLNEEQSSTPGEFDWRKSPNPSLDDKQQYTPETLITADDRHEISQPLLIKELHIKIY
jgi:hypothetical protein